MVNITPGGFTSEKGTRYPFCRRLGPAVVGETIKQTPSMWADTPANWKWTDKWTRIQNG